MTPNGTNADDSAEPPTQFSTGVAQCSVENLLGMPALARLGSWVYADLPVSLGYKLTCSHLVFVSLMRSHPQALRSAVSRLPK
jgi:hypothetical protein